MRVAVLVSLMMGTAPAVSAARDDGAKKALSDLAGTWVAESREHEGKTESKADLKGLKLVVTDNKFVIRSGDGRLVLEGTLTAATDPKGVDVKVTGKDGKEKIIPAIYEVDGDILRTAVPQGDGGRPKDFIPRIGSEVRVTVYRRVKD